MKILIFSDSHGCIETMEAAVRRELAAHLEDKQADLQRIFPDIPPKEAEHRALESMGAAPYDGSFGRFLG